MGRTLADLSIRRKILAGFGALAAAFVVFSAVYLALVVQIQKQADFARRDTLPFVQTINDIRVQGLMLSNTAVRIAHEVTAAQFAKEMGLKRRSQTQQLRSAFSAQRQAMQAAVNSLQELIAARPKAEGSAGHPTVGMEHVHYLLTAAKRIIEESDVLIALAARGADAEQVDQVVKTFATAQSNFSNTVDVAAAGEMTELAKVEHELGRKVRTTIIASVLAIIGAIAIAMFGGRLIAARVANPIQRLNDAAKRIGEGDFAAAVDVSSGDEVGQLASTFNKMRDDLKDAMDKAARSNRLSMLGQVAGTVSHELRNPLGAIKTSLAVIRQLTNGKGLGLDRSLDRADRAVGRCDGIIADMLEYTRTRDMNRAPADFDGWMGGILDEHSLPAAVTLQRDLRAQCQVAIDGERFRQVLVNLLDNAAQAMTDAGWEPPAGRERRIIVRTESAGPHLKLSIIDTGPGIPKAARGKVFEPLFTTKSFGVGLGLPTVQKIVEQHGGTIDVASTGPEGTEFVIWLPRQTETGDPTATQAAA